MSIKSNILQLILNKGNFMSSLNHRLSDFIRIHSIVFCDDLSIAVNFSINGMAQDITVTVNDYSIAMMEAGFA